MSRTLPFQRPVERLAFATLLATAALVAMNARAASPLVSARLAVTLVHADGPSEIMGPATAAMPGDVLEYTTRYQNRGDTPAESLTPTMPIPVGTAYLPSDRSPKPTHASLDGITYAPVPLHRTILGRDGTYRQVEVPPREYRFLRWHVGTLAAGSETVVKARVRLGQVPSLASK